MNINKRLKYSIEVFDVIICSCNLQHKFKHGLIVCNKNVCQNGLIAKRDSNCNICQSFISDFIQNLSDRLVIRLNAAVCHSKSKKAISQIAVSGIVLSWKLMFHFGNYQLPALSLHKLVCLINSFNQKLFSVYRTQNIIVCT